MLLKIALDSTVLNFEADVQRPLSPLIVKIHREFLDRCWLTHGILHHAADEHTFRRTFKDLIDRLPQSLRKIWKSAATQAMKQKRIVGGLAVDVAACESLPDISPISQSVDVALCDEYRAVCLGLPEDAPSYCPQGTSMEICRFDCATESELFSKMFELENRLIRPEDAIDDVWNSRFGPLVDWADHITILDRYGAEDGGSINGLRQLLLKIDQAGKKRRTIDIIVGKKFHDIFKALEDVSSVIEPITGDLCRGGVGLVRLFVAQDKEFQKLRHFRYLRFQDVVCILDTGVSVFYGEKGNVTRPCPCFLQSFKDAKYTREGERTFRGDHFVEFQAGRNRAR
jgi:hypothetical protein